MDQIWIEADQIGRIGRANLRNTRRAPFLQFLADRHALEESFERHFLVDLRENVLVPAEGITDPAHACRHPLVRHAAGSYVYNNRSKNPVSKRAAGTSSN